MGAGQFINPIIDSHKKRGHLPNYLRVKPTIISNFEPTEEAWTGGEADTVNFKTGTQSWKITASASEIATTQINKNLDLRNKDLGFWVYTDKINLSSLQVYLSLGNTSWAKYAAVSVRIPNPGWNWCVVPNTAMQFFGGAIYNDLKDVKIFRFRLTANANGSCSTTFDHIMAFENILDKGKVLFTFDDASETVLTNAAPILDKYDYPATFYVVTSYIDGPTITTAQLKELRDRRWIIASHTKTHVHLPGESEAAQLAELADSQTWLLENGFAPGHKHISFPYGEYNQTTLEYTRRYYTTSRTTLTIDFAGQAQSQFEIPCRAITSGTHSIETVKGMLDTIKARKGTIVFLCHKIGDTGDYSVAEFTEIVDYINGLGLDVINIDDLAKIYGYYS